MRLTCSQKNLFNALSVTSKAVDANNALPVLNNVLLKSEGKKLYFTATNLEIAITCWIETDIKNEGSITVPSKLFTNYISYLKDDKINIEADESNIRITTDDSKTTIKAIPSKEFPSIPVIENEGELTIEAKTFKQAINQVVFASAINTTRPILTGVYFAVTKKELKMAATDSYRLAEKTITIAKSSGDINCIIPAKTIIELGYIIDAIKDYDNKKLNITLSKNQILFSIGNTQLISRLIEGQFPDYTQIIPKSTKTEITFNVNTLIPILKRINIFAKENNNKIIMKVDNDTVNITTDTTQYGEGEVSFKTKIKGENNTIALNSQFLLDVLSHLEADEGIIKIGDKTSPVIVQTKEKNDYIHIIMPLKI